MVKLIDGKNTTVTARGCRMGEMGRCYSMCTNFGYARRTSSRDLLYHIVPIVNNAVMCTSKFFKTIKFMLCVLTTKKQKQNTH